MIQSKAMVVTGPKQMEMRSFPLPELGADDAILKMELAGVCGSDPGIFKGKAGRAPRPYPIILGHEIVGRVEAAGDEFLARRGLELGERVIVEYAFGCGNCAPCRAGRYTLCDELKYYGSMVSCKEPPHLFGAYTQYLYLPPRAMVHKVGDETSPEQAVLISAILGNAVRWLTRVGDLKGGRSVAIVGPGQQGLAATMVARACGASPIMVLGLERDADRLDMAAKLGADVTIMSDREDPEAAVARATDGQMAEVVMDVSGHPSGAPLALSLCGLGATLVLPGLYGMTTEIPLLLDKVVVKELKVLGAYSQDYEAVEAAIKLARRHDLPLADLISHRFPLAEAEHAVHLVGGDVPGEVPMKVVLEPWS
ncbi:MAG: alcohol dehydrogenase catalytic domain-containing protein [Desulfarculaceae bacterium]|nr:alcohol dehydrogenase catalytic domain-containing protein [Desulfarculaceae bacterium]MCF8071244.1 alcohol dehydrogenase catalytic domain-containing protein [Desulfarculaceae bacterium]MCF8101153.1 alcohol dehydrogenase catalytic domain-containing protein [Desulfarculaceae bacterium]MCF8115298.1 alcohol dehydrogenase catalytic domain-containing protein [Desulfarculaceae bacterium]